VVVYRYRWEGSNGSVGPDPVCADRIRSRFYLLLIREGVVFWVSGSGSGLERHKYIFFLCKVVTVPVRFGLLWDRFIGLWNRWVG